MKAVILLMLLASPAFADGLTKFYGQIVVSKDAPPATAGELPKFLAENAAKDGTYERLGGAPWDMNLVAVLSKDLGASTTATLVFLDGGKSMHEVEVAVKGRLVIAHVQATTAAGFEANKPYSLRIQHGKDVLAKAELTLRN